MRTTFCCVLISAGERARLKITTQDEDDTSLTSPRAPRLSRALGNIARFATIPKDMRHYSQPNRTQQRSLPVCSTTGFSSSFFSSPFSSSTLGIAFNGSDLRLPKFWTQQHKQVSNREIFKLAGSTNYETRIFLVMFWRLTFKNFRRKSLAWHSFEVWLSPVHLLAVTGLVLSSPTEENKTQTQKRLSLAKLKSQPMSTNHQWKLVRETTYNTLAKRLKTRKRNNPKLQRTGDRRNDSLAKRPVNNQLTGY